MLVRDSEGVKVTNGAVRDCDGGVVIDGGGGNHVGGIHARDNKVFDLLDGNPECVENTWRRNAAETANQDCTTRR